MWPFTGKRIFGSRWWALGFAALLCWQAVEFADGAGNATNAAETIGGALSNSD